MPSDTRVLAVSRAAVAVAVLLAASAASAQVVARVPNLTPFPAYAITLAPNGTGGTSLIFSTTSWNDGQGPLELVAGETNSQGQNVYQRVYNSDGTYRDYLAGTFVYHPDHGHFHFEDYALYTLQPASANGGSSRTSSKTTFCLMDTNLVDGTLPGAPSVPVYSTCGATIQGMSVGWGDTYGRNLPGQGIDVTGLPEGDYRLVIEIDPKHRLIETNENDNVACTLVHLAPTSVTVLNSNGCSPPATVTVSGISPSSARAGSSTRVTITGAGFTQGMAVSFENGSGPRPVASAVTLVDASTISATVTVKNGSTKGDRIWDVRVGSGVLVDGFTVTR